MKIKKAAQIIGLVFMLLVAVLHNEAFAYEGKTTRLLNGTILFQAEGTNEEIISAMRMLLESDTDNQIKSIKVKFNQGEEKVSDLSVIITEESQEKLKVTLESNGNFDNFTQFEKIFATEGWTITKTPSGKVKDPQEISVKLTQEFERE